MYCLDKKNLFKRKNSLSFFLKRDERASERTQNSGIKILFLFHCSDDAVEWRRRRRRKRGAEELKPPRRRRALSVAPPLLRYVSAQQVTTTTPQNNNTSCRKRARAREREEYAMSPHSVFPPLSPWAMLFPDFFYFWVISSMTRRRRHPPPPRTQHMDSRSRKNKPICSSYENVVRSS